MQKEGCRGFRLFCWLWRFKFRS